MNIATRLLACSLLPLLTACSLIGGSRQAGISIHSPLPLQTTKSEADWPQVDWQLVIARPSAERMIDSARITVRPQPNELRVYRGARWSMPTTDMVKTSVLQVLEDSGRLAGVARSSSGMNADYRLLMDLRRFEADYAGQSKPVATIEISAKLLDSQSQRVVASQIFLYQEAANGTTLAEVVPAFQTALSKSSHAIARWLLQTGQQDHQSGTR